VIGLMMAVGGIILVNAGEVHEDEQMEVADDRV
jgi:spermidine export protein MdtJ